MEYPDHMERGISDDDDACFGEELRCMMGGSDTAAPNGPNGFAGHPVALPKKEICSCFTCELENRFVVDST